MTDLPEGISKVIGSTERARETLQRSDPPDDVLDHAMSALRDYVDSRAERGSTAASSDTDDSAWADPVDAAMVDACPAADAACIRWRADNASHRLRLCSRKHRTIRCSRGTPG